MRRLSGIAAAVLLLLTLGVGAASADPNNSKNSIEFSMSCDGHVVDIVIGNGGAAAHDLDGTATLILMGITDHGQWLIPLVPGQADKDLTQCAYTFPGH